MCVLTGLCALSFGQHLMADGGSSAQLYDFNPFSGPREWSIGGGPPLLTTSGIFIQVDGGAVLDPTQFGAGVYSSPSQNDHRVEYTNAGLGLKVAARYTIEGASDRATMTETYTVSSTASTVHNVNVFVFDDFDLSGSTGGDVISYNNSSNIAQVGSMASLSVTATPPAGWEFGARNTILTDVMTGNLTSTIGVVGPGNLAFAHRWTSNVVTGISNQFGKQMILQVPEPMSLLTVFSLSLGLLRRRKRPN